MSRVDFYILSDTQPDARLRFACRLAEKAVDQGHRVFLQTASADDTTRLDELLWSFNDRSFLPHEIAGPDSQVHARVMIVLGETTAPPTHRQLLINLTNELPAEIETYQRVAEIVDADPERKRIARERYKQYRARGFALESHNL